MNGMTQGGMIGARGYGREAWRRAFPSSAVPAIRSSEEAAYCVEGLFEVGGGCSAGTQRLGRSLGGLDD